MMSIFATGIYEKIRKDIKEKAEVKVKNPKILDVPNNKNFYQMPLKHFIGIAKKKGVSAVQKALANLERFNKNKNPDVSKKASDIIDKLKKNKEFQDIGKKNTSESFASDGIDSFIEKVREDLETEDFKPKIKIFGGGESTKFFDISFEQLGRVSRILESKVNEQLEDEIADQLVIRFNIDKSFARRMLDRAIDLAKEQRKTGTDLDVIEQLVAEFNIRAGVARDIYELALDVLDHREERNRDETLEREDSKIQPREVRDLIQKLNNQKIEARKVGDDLKVAILNDIINTIRRPESNEAKINEVEKGSRPIINQLDDIKQQAEKAIESIKEFESDQTTSGSAKVERTKIRAKKEIDKVSVLVKELRTQFVLESEKTNEFLLRGKKIDFGKIDSFIKEAEELLGEAKEFSLERIDTVINPLDALVTLIKELDKDVILEQEVCFKSLVGYKVQVNEIIEMEAPDLKDKYTWDTDRGLRPKEGFVDDIKEVLEQSKLFSEIRWNEGLNILEIKIHEQEEEVLEQQGVDIDERDLLDEIVLAAENEGDFFRNKDPRGAVEFVIKNLRREKESELRETLRNLKDNAAEQVRISWGLSKEEIKENIMNKDLYKMVKEKSNINEQLDPVDFDKEDIMGEIGIEAQRKTDFKKTGDAVGAVDDAAEEVRKKIVNELDDIISSVRQDAIEHVEEVWKENKRIVRST